MPRVPPEPFHWIGGESIRLGIAKKEEAEMDGRPPRLRSLPPFAKVPPRLGSTRPIPHARPDWEGRPSPPRYAIPGSAMSEASCSGRIAVIFSARRCCQVAKPIATTVVKKRIIATT